MMRIFNDKSYSEKLIFVGRIIVCALILLSMGISFRILLLDAGFWFDEASLAYNFVTRDFWQLVSKPLEAEQSAPILYLYTVKIFQILFGTSEFVFRLPSFFFYVGLVLCTYKVLKLLEVKIPLTGTLLVSGFCMIMRYSAEMKQYMAESFWLCF